MEITMLGTGNALVTECYNTCFVIKDNKQLFMVDGGGGNTLLAQLKRAGFNWMDVRHIFVTHKHIDHLLGIIWLVRMICQYMNQGEYAGEAQIYANDEVVDLIQKTAAAFLQEEETRFIGQRLHLVAVADGDNRRINGRKVTFFDIHSTKARQFGFSIVLGHIDIISCCGDEPCNAGEEKYVRNAKWLLHDAFCLHSQADLFVPYEKHHSTVKNACELAERLGVKNLILYHTEDQNIRHRRELYLAEGRQYFHGNLFIPDDLETIRL